MSQAGITRGDMADYLEGHGWEHAPRRHGEKATWLDPLDGEELSTMEAYEVAWERAAPERAGRRAPR